MVLALADDLENRHKQAVRHVERALAIEPEHPRLHRLRGEVSGSVLKAVESARAASVLDPRSALEHAAAALAWLVPPLAVLTLGAAFIGGALLVPSAGAEGAADAGEVRSSPYDGAYVGLSALAAAAVISWMALRKLPSAARRPALGLAFRSPALAAVPLVGGLVVLLLVVGAFLPEGGREVLGTLLCGMAALVMILVFVAGVALAVRDRALRHR